MDENAVSLFKTLIKMHFELVAHVETQGAAIEALAKNQSVIQGQEFDAESFRAQLAAVFAECQQRMAIQVENLDAAVAAHLFRTPRDEAPPEAA
jgi:hypothetical protein